MTHSPPPDETQKNSIRWGVVATVSEPEPLILAFVAHWRALGAARITLYFDAPAPQIAKRLRRVPECETITCNNRYWAERGQGRPLSQTQRQTVNIERSYQATDLDWLFHVDADEFLYLHEGGTVAELLAGIPKAMDVLQFRAAERFHDGSIGEDTIFEGVFRHAVPPKNAEETAKLDGPAAAFLDCGVAAYPGYKVAFRAGRSLSPSIHGAVGASPDRACVIQWADLLHFDGLTSAHWIWKKRRALAQLADKPGLRRPAIQAQFEAVAAATSPEEERSIYELVKVLDAPRLEVLERYGLIVRPEWDPRETAWSLFGKDGLDYRPDAFVFEGIKYFSHLQAKRARNAVRNRIRENEAQAEETSEASETEKAGQ